jgi:hypothetical protein
MEVNRHRSEGQQAERLGNYFFVQYWWWTCGQASSIPDRNKLQMQTINRVLLLIQAKPRGAVNKAAICESARVKHGGHVYRTRRL